MQQQTKAEASRERNCVAIAMIKEAIHDRACLSGTNAQFRVRFAPHALGRDGNGRHVVVAFEYGGLTTGRPNWVWFAVDRLRDLQWTSDQWRTGSLKSRLPFELTEVEIAVDDSWVGSAQPNAVVPKRKWSW